MTDEPRPIAPREGYDRWAPHYDGYDNPLIALEAPIVAELLGPLQGLRIADIGCGTGRHALRLAAAGARVTGVDFSSGMLDALRAKQAFGSLEIVEHDLAAGIPLEGDAFDRVLCCLVLEHLPDADAMLAELARICKPGGRVLVTDFHPEMVRRGYHARFRESPGEQKFQMHGAYRPVSGYVTAALDAGLRIEHISEHVVDEALLERSQSAEKWLGLPFLLVLKLAKSIEGSP